MLYAFINNLCVNETDLLQIFPFSINKPRGEKNLASEGNHFILLDL